MILKTNKYLFSTLIFFGLIYTLISIVNHYNFRTYALDLGLYTNALYKYAHFQLADSQMIKQDFEYLLGGHFDLYLVFFSPLVYIFKSYTLLIIQIVSILAGSIGIYRYFSLPPVKHPYLPLLAAAYFLLFYGVYSAVSYDYHSVVVAAMLIPWLFYFMKKGNYILASLFVALVLISQENASLWLFFICLALAFEYRKNKSALLFASCCALVSLIYFLAVIYLIIPSFSGSHEYTGFTYSVLGSAPMEAFRNLLLHPADNIKILFTNHNNSLDGDYVKMEMLIMVMVSGAFMLLLKPHYLLMLIPVFFQKLFHDNSVVWGIDGQYSIEFAPILAIGVFSAISEFNNAKSVKILSAIVIFGAFLATFRLMDNTVFYTNKSKIRFYVAAHYQRKYNVREVHEQLSNLPADAAISAMTPFVPHLSLRDKIYQFPLIKDAEYIVVSEKEGKWPLDEEMFDITINEIMESGDWETKYKSDDFVVLKRED